MGYDTMKPEKYGMVFCPDCQGSGREEETEGPCQKCAGFGWLISRENRCPTSQLELCGNKRGKNLLL
jgi:DnaJ-class molecular chaperone